MPNNYNNIYKFNTNRNKSCWSKFKRNYCVPGTSIFTFAVIGYISYGYLHEYLPQLIKIANSEDDRSSN